MIVVCENCSIKFEQPLAWYKRSKHHCCSRECSGRLRNKLRKGRRKKKISTCELCGKNFDHYTWEKRKYCSLKCHYIKLKCSANCYNFRNGIVKKIKRGTAFYDNLLDNASCACGISQKYLLQIHHIDGNNKNNAKENIEIVCAHCHIKRHLKRRNKDGQWVYSPKSLTPRELLPEL